MENASPFLQRVLQRIPKTPVTKFHFESWNAAGKVTTEGFGLLPVPGADPDKMIACIMDGDHYKGNVDFVEENRSIEDERFVPPDAVRIYQRLRIPVLGNVHHELVLRDFGEHEGFRIIYWDLLEPETTRLNPKTGFRSQYNDGAWLLKPDLVGYALSSAPRREDVGFLKWKALTKGADVGAAQVVKGTIEAFVRWAKSR